uniref:Alpha 1,4-glycosyltransferase domain-containing protein n=1 Tax=viral metagenome TaxID=1070528 RepID=A0A6C0DZY9_9ZZZZ
MKLLFKYTDYNETIKLALDINENFDNSVIFHCYWYGSLNKKHLYSIKSCYYFNRKNKIILWLENNLENEYNNEIKKYAEIKYLSLNDEKNKTFLKNYNCNFHLITYYSDFIRTLLLYNYGGCWFDLDCFFLRSFNSLFFNYKDEICVYQWENQNYPNNAIYISLEPNSEKMKKNIEYIANLNRGWGFQQANLTYDLPLDMLVLPCSWFDADWIKNPYEIGTEKFFENTNTKYTFDNFFSGCFCYHWHNKWEKTIENNSIIEQLNKIIDRELQSNFQE